MKKIDPIITVDGWDIYNNTYGFYCCNNGKTLYFHAEYKNGTYFNIKSYYDGKRCYTAQRYFYKLIPLVQTMTFELLQKNKLWDYKNGCTALETYKKDMLPYYKRCKEKGLETSLFLESLYSDLEIVS